VKRRELRLPQLAEIQKPTSKHWAPPRPQPFHTSSMDLPSTRELELETLLREKDAQLAEVTVCSLLASPLHFPTAKPFFLQDEIIALRQYLSQQPGPSTTDAVTLPPALLSLLLPHINSATTSTTTTPSTVTAALTQRAHLLQEENDELYELLKSSETGKLRDEVRGLRRTVGNLQGALEGMFIQDTQ